jgi:hypothetical protein
MGTTKSCSRFDPSSLLVVVGLLGLLLTLNSGSCSSLQDDNDGLSIKEQEQEQEQQEEDLRHVPGQLTTKDRTGIPRAFRQSQLIIDAYWDIPKGSKTPTIPMVKPDGNQAGGDVHPYTYGEDGNLYTTNDDPEGGSMLPRRKVEDGTYPTNHIEVLSISGHPGDTRHSGKVFPLVSQADPRGVGVGNPLPGADGAWGDWSYSNGITSVHGVLFMGHSGKYNDGETYNLNRPPNKGGFNGIDYSLDRGVTWHSGRVPTHLIAGHEVAMYFVQEAQDSPHSPRPFNTAPGPGNRRYIYAITHDKEFAGSYLRVGRVPVPENWEGSHRQASAEAVADLGNWEWFYGKPENPRWTHDAKHAASLPGLNNNTFMDKCVMYPGMSYDAALGVYLLTFTKMNYRPGEKLPWHSSNPGYNTWRSGGGRVVIMEGEQPWGPFNFVAQDDIHAATMKYSVQVLTKDQGSIDPRTHEQKLVVTHTGAYGGCESPECHKVAPGFDYGGYGTSFRVLVLKVRSNVTES